MNLKDNRGYMLVEIVLASAIAFGVAFFITSLTIKIKNKNDDTLVMTQVSTDQAIITNGLMKYAIEEKEDFDCDLIDIQDNKIMYNKELIDIVSEYTSLGSVKCNNDHGEVNVLIPLEIKQLKDKDYNININYKYLIGDIASPNLFVTIDNGKAVVELSDNRGIKNGTYTIKYDFIENPSSCDSLSNSFTFTINGNKTITKEIDLSGHDEIYVCNKEDISDNSGNILTSGNMIHVY